jgi:hypothetical protein
MVGTNNSAGLLLGVPAYITTYVAQTNQTAPSGNIAGTGFTSTTTAGLILVGTNNTAGLSVGVPNWITTYVGQSTQTQPAGNIAGIGTTTTTQAGSTLGATLSTNGLSLAVPLWLTAAAGGGGFTGGVSTGGNTLGNTGTQTGSLIFVGGNNITLSVGTAAGGAQTITISGANAGGAQTGISSIVAGGTTYTSGSVQYVNSNGFSWLSTTGQGILGSYTVPIVTQYFSNTATTFNGANISGSITHNTAGLQLSLSVGAQISTVGLYALGNTTQNSSTTFNQSAISFNALGAASWGYSNGSVQVSVPATSSISGTGLVSVSVNGSTISIGAAPAQLSVFQPLPFNGSTVTQLGQGTVQIYPAFDPEAFSASRADIMNSFSISSLGISSYAGAVSYYVGLYTRNGSTLSLASSGSQSYQFTMSSSNSLSLLSGIRRASLPFNANYTGGDLWIGLMSLTTSTNANSFTASNVAVPYGNQAALNGLIGAAPNSSYQLLPGLGFYSVSSASMPVSMGFSDISGIGGGNNVAANLVPVQFVNISA